MKLEKKDYIYLGIIVVAAIVLAIVIFGKGNDNSSEEKYRKELQEQREESAKRVEGYKQEIEAIKQKMLEDRKRFEERMAEKELQYQRLKKEHDKINFRDYTADQLDSVRRRLYPDLYQN